MDEIYHRFPINSRVVMTKEALKQFPAYADRAGTVIGYSRQNILLRVLWDGNKVASNWSQSFLLADQEKPNA